MQQAAPRPAPGQPQPQWGQGQPVPGQPPQGQPRPAWGPAQPPWGQPVAQQRPPQGYPQQFAPAQPGYAGQPGGYPPPQPPRSGSPLKLLLLGAVAVIALGFFAFALTNFLTTQPEVAVETPEGPGPQPTPTIGETSAPPVGVPEPEQNPPDIPWPTTVEEAFGWLQQNALYAQSVPVPTNCTLGRVSILDSTDEELQEHLNLLTACLMMVWQEPMKQAGFSLHRPPITLYSETITTACGALKTRNAYYCGGDQRLYFARDIHEIFGPNGTTIAQAPFFVDNIMGHEFGHFLQGRTGIWGAYSGLRGGTPDKNVGLELSRRVETQADCFAGAFLNAVSQASRITDEERRGTTTVTQYVGDDYLAGLAPGMGDHGIGVNRVHWFTQGLNSAQLTVCNTWTVPKEQVD